MISVWKTKGEKQKGSGGDGKEIQPNRTTSRKKVIIMLDPNYNDRSTKEQLGYYKHS